MVRSPLCAHLLTGVFMLREERSIDHVMVHCLFGFMYMGEDFMQAGAFCVILKGFMLDK